MRELTIAELLGVWERGQDRPPVERALGLLAAACPETGAEALAELSLGERDSRLLALREWTFGPRLAGVAACPACGERVELDFEAARLRAQAAATPRPATAPAAATEPAPCVTPSGHAVRFRLPSSRDALAVAGSGSLEEARRLLLSRCLLESRSAAGEPVPAAMLSAEDLAAVMAHIAAADPLAEVEISLDCPGCAYRWEVGFDIVSYFWDEIEAWVGRVLADVHRLASAYGWSEAEILAMSPWRRRRYLDLVAAQAS
jgi:hypothetical protein